MKTVCCFLVILLARQAVCGIIRNPPAFSKPVYSDSYLPAAMQVIFHAVEQLKLLQTESTTQTFTTTKRPSTTPIKPTTHNQEISTTTLPKESSTISTQESSTTTTQRSPTITTQESPTSTILIQSTEGTEEKRKESNTEESQKDKKEEQKDQKDQEASTNVTEASMNKINEPSTTQNTDTEKVEQTETNETPNDQIKIEEASEVQTKESSTQKTPNIEPEKVEEPKIEEATENAKVEEASSPQTDQEPMEDPSKHEESPEVNEETPETNYATPETNYEEPEAVHVLQETNEEVPEENHEEGLDVRTTMETRLEATTASSSSSNPSTDRGSIAEDKDKKKEPTIDSVIQGVYQILKPTPSKFKEVEEGALEESKSAMGTSAEKMETLEEEEEETRFTRLGERVTQVPRPSLSSYLKHAKVPPSTTLQQLANLYDSLSKDARKQGFGKYTGYSDEVLNTLETSAEGGIGPQLQKILSKVLERNELTRDDAKTRTTQTVRDLDNPSSGLNKELRPLLPLRYSP